MIPKDAYPIGEVDGLPLHLRRDNTGYWSVYYRDAMTGVIASTEENVKIFAFKYAAGLNRMFSGKGSLDDMKMPQDDSHR